jgi:hypothetical protein
LRELARHSLVTFEPSISARQTVLDVFAAAGLTPKIILRAIDAAVVEAGVERGLGPAILAQGEYDPLRDADRAMSQEWGSCATDPTSWLPGRGADYDDAVVSAVLSALEKRVREINAQSPPAEPTPQPGIPLISAGLPRTPRQESISHPEEGDFDETSYRACRGGTRARRIRLLADGRPIRIGLDYAHRW